MGSLRERTRLSTALNDIDITIHSNLAFDEIMQAALNGFVDALHADVGDIKLRTDTGWIVRYEQGFGPDVIGLRLSVAEAPVATRVAETRAPVTIRDYLAEPEGFYVGFPRMHNLRSTLGTPLVIRDEVVGCLFAWMRNEPRAFSRGETDFARRIATSVALALDNAELLQAEQQARHQAQWAEQRLEEQLAQTRVLLRASDELTSTTDADELLQRLTTIVLEASGISRAFINVIDEDAQVLIPKIATGGLAALEGDAIPFSRLSETARAAIAGKKTILLDYELPSAIEADRAIARANSARVVLFVPLLSQDRIIGHISLDQPNERYPFSEEQIRIVESIAAQAAVALEHAHLFEREHRIAETLQQAILSPPERVEGIELASLYQPASDAADVGGDFYDVLNLGDGRVALLIGDVAGKGVEAAKLTSLIRDGARAYLAQTDDPATVIGLLNNLAYRFMPEEKFATAFLGVLDRCTGLLRYSGAGHPPPIVVGPGRPSLLEPAPGLLGAFPNDTYAALETTLATDEVLVLITDGVTEARSATAMLGEQGVIEALERLRETPVPLLPEQLLEEVVRFSGGRLRDDVVILCVSHIGCA